jgi:hypothetical protein
MWSVEAGDWVSWAVPLSQQLPLMGGASAGHLASDSGAPLRRRASSPLLPSHLPQTLPTDTASLKIAS